MGLGWRLRDGDGGGGDCKRPIFGYTVLTIKNIFI